MSILLKFERRIEELVEGVFGRLARDRIHPVEIGRRVLREMETGAVAGLHGAVLPNEYRIYLNPRDFAPYSSFVPSLAAEITEALIGRAAELDATLAGPVQITVEPRDAIAAGQIYVEARLAPPPAGTTPVGAGTPPVGAGAPPEGAGAADGSGAAPTTPQPGVGGTRVYRGPAPGPRLRVLAGPAGTAGSEFPLDRPVITIGRRADQDIVLDDPSVSRAHARVHAGAGEVVVEDLDSTNGTSVNGRRLGRARVPVHDGDRIKIGTVLLEYRRGSAP